VKRFILLVSFLLACCLAGLACAADTASALRPVHTYSIVARDPDSGELGVAVQSHWFAVGLLVPWAEPGVGAVATQSFVDVRYGWQGLELMREGLPAPAVLARLLQADPTPEVRQVGMIDAQGRIARHTGRQCIAHAGQLAGENFAVQANLMLNHGVPEAMAAAFRQARGTLAERMLAALEAAQAQGGDLRGRQSAALVVVSGTRAAHPRDGRLVDLHVEDHPAPLAELRRLLRLNTAYEYMNRGDHALESRDVDGALQQYGNAEALFPDNLEMQFWHAVALVNAGRVPEAVPLFDRLIARDDNWRELVSRLADAGLLQADHATVQRLTAPANQEETP